MKNTWLTALLRNCLRFSRSMFKAAKCRFRNQQKHPRCREPCCQFLYVCLEGTIEKLQKDLCRPIQARKQYPASQESFHSIPMTLFLQRWWQLNSMDCLIVVLGIVLLLRQRPCLSFP